jgi:hypothetical protein
MVKFVDVPLDNGDPNRAITALNEAVAESSTRHVRQQQETQDTSTVTRQADVDPRFAGKSTAEIVNMYKNLESHSGRLASQLGTARQTLDQVILEKRSNDIRQNSPQREPIKVQPTDMMTNPTEAIDRLLADRLANLPEVSAVKQRIAELEAQLSQTTFVTRHPHAQEVTLDPAFQAWVAQTPLRQKLNADAAGGNSYAADALLTEWQAAKPTATSTVATSRAQEAARKLNLESGNTGSESGHGPSRSARTFKSSDLIRLRQTNPDLYESEAYQKQIVAAYTEGRVTRD